MNYSLIEHTSPRVTRILVALAILIFATMTTRQAKAEGEASRLNIDWGKLSDAIREGEVALFPRETTNARKITSTGQPERFFGLSPHLSLVARDWGGAQLLVGDKSVTDIIRLSRSSRMVVSRLRLAEGRLAPFVQLGLGQWRIDTDLMPVLPRDTELAAQVGGGFEMRVMHGWNLALEMDYTALYRESREEKQVPIPNIWGAFVATRAQF